MNNSREHSDRDIVRMLARKHGSHYRPSWYISQAQREYQRDISNSTVTKSLGCYRSRLSTDTNDAVALAKRLLSHCKHDVPFAEHILHKAFLS